jgi:omega-amidase
MRVVIAQTRVERGVASNSETIRSLLRRSRPGDWVVFPEGALTGYFPSEDDYLAGTGALEVEAAVDGLRAIVARQRCHCVVGTARCVAERWRNAAALIAPGGEVRWYEKNTLTASDSRHFVPGDELSVFEVDGVKVAVQSAGSCFSPASGGNSSESARRSSST